MKVALEHNVCTSNTTHTDHHKKVYGFSLRQSAHSCCNEPILHYSCPQFNTHNVICAQCKKGHLLWPSHTRSPNKFLTPTTHFTYDRTDYHIFLHLHLDLNYNSWVFFSIYMYDASVARTKFESMILAWCFFSSVVPPNRLDLDSFVRGNYSTIPVASKLAIKLTNNNFNQWWGR